MDQEVAAGWRERGRVCVDEKRYDEALAIYDAVLAGQPDADDERDAWIQKSAALLGLDRAEEAFVASDRALALAPASAAAWTSKARSLGHLERYDEELIACDRAIELDPVYAAAWKAKGAGLFYLKRLDDALDAFDHARALEPASAVHWYDVGLTLLYLNRYDEALAAFDGALSASDGLTPELASGVWNDKGVALDQLERYTEALGAYEHSLALDAEFAAGWDNKGTALVSLERYEDALDAYDHALGLDPSSAQAWNNKGRALGLLERYDEALTGFDRALAIDPTHAAWWIDRTDALLDLGRNGEALDAANRAREIDPDSVTALQRVCRALELLGRDEDAVRASDDYLARNNTEGAAWYVRAAALTRLERREEAMASLERGLELDPALADDWATWRLKGNLHRTVGQFEQAAEAYQRAVDIDPEDEDTWAALGSELTRFGRWEEALAAFDHGIALNPDHLWSSERRAASLFTLKRYEEAVAAYDRLITLAPRQMDAWYWKGVAQLRMGSADALTTFDRALALGADDDRIHAGRASALCNLQRNEEALTETELALARNSDNVDAWQLKALALLRLNRPQEALDASERGLAVQPEHTDLLYRRIAALLMLRREEEALERCEELPANQRDEGRFWNAKGLVLSQLKRTEDSLAAFEEGLRVEPDSVDLLLGKTNQLKVLKRYNAALDVLDQTMGLLANQPTAQPKSLATIWKSRSDIYAEQGRSDEAIAAYQRAVKLTPDDTAALTDLGDHLLKAGRGDEALGIFDRVIALLPDASWAVKNRAAALFTLKRYEEALAAYERVIALQPGDADALHWMGLTLQQLGRYDEALTTFDEALKLAPGNGRIRASRDELFPWMRRTIADQLLRLPDGRELGYLDVGDPNGIPVFYFHGLPGSRLEMVLYEPLLKDLGARLIAPDRPGYGLSTYQSRRTILDWPDDVLALADHLSIARFAVLGVSGGGAYALACAYKIPDRLLACGLVSSAAPPEAFSGEFEWTLTHISRQIARYSPELVLRFVSTVGASQARSNTDRVADIYRRRNEGTLLQKVKRDAPASQWRSLTPTEREIITEPYHHGGRGAARDSWLIARAWGFPLHGITIPVHLWHGKLDVLAPMSTARYLATHVPTCQATYYPDARHDLFNAHGREILAALLAASAEADNKTS